MTLYNATGNEKYVPQVTGPETPTYKNQGPLHPTEHDEHKFILLLCVYESYARWYLSLLLGNFLTMWHSSDILERL
jgi:hypothetical protein